MGITFKDRIFPFDIIPRLITSVEWKILERGLKQRIEALNLFIGDIYNAKKILKDKVIPEEIIYSSTGYLRACEGIKPAKNIWTHVSGIDLIRHEDGRYYVLEDNLRVPSGVSYVLGNREICKNSFSQSLENMGVKPVADYPMKLKSMLKYCAENVDASVVVLTPGIHNSAYFEHSFLAKQMGVPLVEGRDLTIFQNKVFMRTTKGFEKVDVIYRRIDDTFLDPFEFNPDSVLGVPGLFQAFSKGNVVLANAPGTGVADDKAVYAYVPEMIKYYLNEEPILNNVPTHLCWKEKDKQYVIEHLEELVVKPVSESGGYGLLIGPQSSASERDLIKEKIIKSPRNFIAQPTLKLSTVPTLIDHKVEARHVDLRPSSAKTLNTPVF
jgi:uncharacterized circularly permuted ATP-grasp superfamily protein